MKTSAKEQIVNMFKDVSRLDNCEYTIDFQNISVENFDPPAYIVRIIFIDVLGLPDYGRMDKVHWHTIFNYKGKTILIRDYKFGTWSVESKTYDESTKEVVSEIMEKIKIASNSIDKVLYEYLKYYVHNGNFYIKNMNNSLASIFYFYLGKTQGAIDDIKNVKLDTERKEVDVVSTLQPLTDLWNKTCKLTEIAFHYTYSMIHAFYSYLEFIFDVVYAFEQPNIDFWEFRKKPWGRRFKIVFDLKVKEINEMYLKLLEYRNKYRNPLSHGLTNEISVLVPLPGSGLVPLSYQFLSNELYYSIRAMNDIKLAEQIIETFGSFLFYLSKNEPYCYYMRYAEYNFEIPVNKKDIEELKKNMSSIEDFEAYLQGEASYWDAVINRDI